MIGQTISHYRIVEKLGEGGMGVVYKAKDLKLDRSVALKFLAGHLVSDPGIRKRFEREAKAAAAITHANIAVIHEIDESDAHSFIAMEFVEGMSVREKTAERPLKLQEALDIAIQASQGLQAAHQRGIVHRDIKSANLMITPQGQVKIMDFGLAQLADHTRLTRTSTSLGTPAYMSPEQAQRQPTDRRTDIWSLGVVIYEMVTGQLPFEGEREQAIIYAIANEQPEPITALRAGVPIELDHIVGKAMAKKLEERYQHLDDMLVDLRTLRSNADREARLVSVPVKPKSRGWVWGLAAALVVVLAVILGVLSLMRGNGETTTTATSSDHPRPLTSLPGREENPALSPDGTRVAFTWSGETGDNVDIYVQVVGSTNKLRLTTDPARDIAPAWSPDGRQIAFVRDAAGTGRTIYLTSALGGVETKVAAASDITIGLWRTA